jgi:hypothetical protein
MLEAAESSLMTPHQFLDKAIAGPVAVAMEALKHEWSEGKA